MKALPLILSLRVSIGFSVAFSVAVGFGVVGRLVDFFGGVVAAACGEHECGRRSGGQELVAPSCGVHVLSS
jgi:hypothetical protein